MTKLFLAALMTAITLMPCAQAKDDTKVEYIGGGRYSCQGDSFKCSQIEQQNRAESDRQRREYQRDQDRAQDYVDRQRQREDEYMRRTYGR